MKERVTARMKKYMNKCDRLKKLEIVQLELLMSPEDSESNLKYILTIASRRSSRIFEIYQWYQDQAVIVHEPSVIAWTL